MTSRRTANAAAILVIMSAGAVSALWAFIVPIFQATDEAAHYDYAMGIFAARHLISVRDRHPVWIATPYARYLLGATEYFRIAFHSSMRAPAGYGSLAYYHRLDASAPSLNPPHDGGGISYIGGGYPFGFYALEALWIGAVATAINSLTATFFAARLLCVFLTMAGLYFAYRAALNIGVPARIALALVAASGFFPLTSLVSSYVQPDNLSYALVALTLFLATSLPQSKRPGTTLCVLGFALAALAVTKYQFFVSVFIPIALFLFFSGNRAPSMKRVAIGFAWLCIPIVVALGVQFTFVARPPWAPSHQHAGGASASPGIISTIGTVVRSGPQPAASYLLHNASKAFLDFYVSGSNVATYWGAVGLWDTPIVIVSAGVEIVLRMLISLISVVVVATMIYRTIANAARLVRVGSRRGVWASGRIAFSDPVFNSFALFTILLFVLYASTANIFGAVGRQWYPYIFAAFLCTAWYAPRTFRGRLRAASPLVAAALLLYSIVASVYATRAIVERYYGPPSGSFTSILPANNEVVGGTALGSLWPIQGMDFHPIFARRFRTTFPPGAKLWAGGASIFPDQHAAANPVAVVVDGRLAARVLARQYNFQIAEATKDLTFANSGFFASMDTARLGEGPHEVKAYAKVPGTARFQAIAPSRLFFIAADGKQLSQALSHELDRAPSVKWFSPTSRSCGDLLLITGSDAGFATRHDAVAWAVGDRIPYPGALDRKNNRFSVAVPYGDFANGKHRVRVFLTDPSNRETIRGSTAYSLTIPERTTTMAPANDADCDDGRRLVSGA